MFAIPSCMRSSGSSLTLEKCARGVCESGSSLTLEKCARGVCESGSSLTLEKRARGVCERPVLGALVLPEVLVSELSGLIAVGGRLRGGPSKLLSILR